MAKDIYSQLPEAILPWYQQNKRNLPWRKDREPYHVWLSEIMLQQTRVEAVKGYYQRFLEALPTVAALANAEDNLLNKLWEGLGYYSRVRNLKKAAQVIIQEYEGHFPSDYASVLKLPGIGEYTAGAICSISFGQPVPAVDGNVLRVISRLTDDQTPIDLPQYKKQVRSNLLEIYPKEAGEFTQALMELGATVCGPNKKPECETCPCRGFCLGYQRNTAQSLPVRLPKKGRRVEEKTVLILYCEGCYGLQVRPKDGLLGGLWQFPNIEGKMDISRVIAAVEKMGGKPKELLRVVEKKHIFTHVLWDMCGVYMEISEKIPQLDWFTADQIRREIALPTAFRQFWDEIEFL